MHGIIRKLIRASKLMKRTCIATILDYYMHDNSFKIMNEIMNVTTALEQ